MSKKKILEQQYQNDHYMDHPYHDDNYYHGEIKYIWAAMEQYAEDKIQRIDQLEEKLRKIDRLWRTPIDDSFYDEMNSINEVLNDSPSKESKIIQNDFVHIKGFSEMSTETQQALLKMVEAAKNQVKGECQNCDGWGVTYPIGMPDGVPCDCVMDQMEEQHDQSMTEIEEGLNEESKEYEFVVSFENVIENDWYKKCQLLRDYGIHDGFIGNPYQRIEENFTQKYIGRNDSFENEVELSNVVKRILQIENCIAVDVLLDGKEIELNII